MYKLYNYKRLHNCTESNPTVLIKYKYEIAPRLDDWVKHVVVLGRILALVLQSFIYFAFKGQEQ